MVRLEVLCQTLIQHQHQDTDKHQWDSVFSVQGNCNTCTGNLSDVNNEQFPVVCGVIVANVESSILDNAVWVVQTLPLLSQDYENQQGESNDPNREHRYCDGIDQEVVVRTVALQCEVSGQEVLAVYVYTLEHLQTVLGYGRVQQEHKYQYSENDIPFVISLERFRSDATQQHPDQDCKHHEGKGNYCKEYSLNSEQIQLCAQILLDQTPKRKEV